MPREEITETARVIELHGQRAKLAFKNEILDAVLSGKLRLADSHVSTVAVGDYVEFSGKDRSLVSIENVAERKRYISKPATEKEEFKQILISNVDRLIIVASVAQPRFNYGIVERFLVIAFREDVRPVIVLNKIDLKDPGRIRFFLDSWKNLSCDVFFTSAKTGEGIDRLKDIILTGTSVIVGHSGVGKSSILNFISPGLNITTKMISSYSNRGAHATSRVSLYKISENGWIADTPGLKVLGLSGMKKNDLQYYFPDFQSRIEKCRFTDCCHIDEPGCGVKESVKNKVIPEFRYISYKRIYETLKK